MKKINLKALLVAGVLVVAYALLSGCGQKNGSAGSTVSPSITSGAVTATGDSKQTAAVSPGTTGDQNNGKTVYMANCMACHADGNGGHNGPSLTESQITKDRSQVVKQVTNGGKNMPPFKGTLTDQQIQDVAAYVTEVIAKN